MPYYVNECFRVDAHPGVHSLGGTSGSTADEADANVTTETPATSVNTWVWTYSGVDYAEVTGTTKTVSIAGSELSATSAGMVKVEFASSCGRKAFLELPFVPYWPAETKTFNGFVSGSASEAFGGFVTSAAAGGGGVWHYAEDGTADPGAWSASIDLSVVSTSNPKVTLIAPQHAITSAHYPPSVGTTINFMLAGSLPVSTSVSAVFRHPDYQNLYPDIAVVKLTEPVTYPSYAKILPKGLPNKFVSVGWGTPGGRLYHNAEVVAVVMQRQNRAVPVGVWSMASGRLSLVKPIDSASDAYNVPFVAGDSSSPVLITDGSTTCVLGCLTGGGNGSGTALDSHFDWVKSAVLASGGPEISPADLSSYPSY